MSNIRIPTQKRSIDKRNNIIKKGFELICNKGYHNVTTADIAKYANVSTGIIYQYFNDKKDIFIEGIKNYANSILFPMMNVLDNEKVNMQNLDVIVTNMIDRFLDAHKLSKTAHEELIAMSHLDEDIAEIFKNNEIEMTDKIVTIFKNSNIQLKNIEEKVHIAYNLIDILCHEIVYHKHEKINYDVMKRQVVSCIVSLLGNE